MVNKYQTPKRGGKGGGSGGSAGASHKKGGGGSRQIAATTTSKKKKVKAVDMVRYNDCDRVLVYWWICILYMCKVARGCVFL